MRHRLRRALEAAALPTLALVAALVALPGRTALSVHVWLLVVLGLALIALVAGVREDVPGGPSPFAGALAAPSRSAARPPSLARVEREISMGSETAFDAHVRLRPLFRELAGGLLLDRHGIDLDRSPALARGLVGDDLWSLVRPGVELPEHRGGAGPSPSSLERAIADLERLAWS